MDQYINERTELPDELVKDHPGDLLVQMEGAQLMPIQDCESNDLNQNSLRLIQKAAQAYNQENQLLQRHKLRAISVVECTCVYNTEPFRVWIVGQDQYVHCPDFPSKCSCTILWKVSTILSAIFATSYFYIDIIFYKRHEKISMSSTLISISINFLIWNEWELGMT